MKKLILLIIVCSSIIFAQDEIKNDNTSVKDTLTTNEDYKVEDKNDTWMDTWKEIEPSIRDFLSDEDDEEIEWKEEDGERRRVKKKRGYFRAAGGGWDIFQMPLAIDEINTQVKSMGLGEFSSTMDYYGGGGWVFLGDNYRIGGLGADGSMMVSDTDDGIRKKVEFDMQFGGFMIERVWHPFSKTEISLGGVIGRSKLKLKVFKKQGYEDWDKAWTSFDKNDTEDEYYNYKTTFTNSYFSAMPSIGVRYNIVRVFAIGAKVGYYYGITQDNNWEINGSELEGVPSMDLSNVFYSINFYFGA
ncbi:MAG: hypothetical protein ACLFQM_05070 [Fidelibacterota bacterium]